MRRLRLGQSAFHGFFADVEVRVHGVDVVVVLERLDQVEQGLRLPVLDRDGVFGSMTTSEETIPTPASSRAARTAARSLGAVSTRNVAVVLDDVLGPGVDRDDQVVLVVAIAVDERSRRASRRSRRPSWARRGCRRGGRRRGGSPSRSGCGCRTAPRRGSRPRRGRSPRRGSARARRHRPLPPSRDRSPAGCCPSASTGRAPSGSRSPGSVFPSGSPPPSRAATVIARASFVNSFPRFASVAPFLCLIDAHFE